MPGAEQFMSYAAQQGSMFSGHSLETGMTPLGLLDSGLSMMGMPTVAAQYGMYPGQFFPQHNLQQQMRADAFRSQQAAAVTAAMQKTDVNSWLQTSQGAAQMLGLPFGLDQRAAFRQTYTSMAPMLSMLAQYAPDTVDALHGSKGSAAVMAANLFKGGQYRMGADGRPEMSAAAIGNLSETIGSQLYGDSGKIASMRGVGMGALGQLFDESSRRGLLPGSIGARSRETQLKMLSEEEGKTVKELSQLSDSDMGAKLRQFDSSRVAGRLKELAGSISAMKEIFGANGQPDAPMAHLLNALENITQNRLGSMPAAQVEQTVRKTKALMEGTGMSLDGIMSLTARSAAYGDQLGLSRGLAIHAGQNAAAMGAGYKNAFGNFGAYDAMSVEEVTARETLLSTRAGGSQQAQFAGAAIRTTQALGLGADTRAGKLSAALKRGETTFEGQSMYQVLRSDALSGIFRASGAGDTGVAALRSAMSDSFGNQEAIAAHNLGGLVRQLQPQEIGDKVGRSAGESAVMQALVASGVPQAEAVRQARAMGPGLLRAMQQTDNVEALASAGGRQKIIENELAKTMGAERAGRMAGAVSVGFESNANRLFKHYGYGDLTKYLQNNNQTVIEQGQRIHRVADADADISRMLAPLGKAGPIQRVMDMIQAGTGNEEIGKTLGTALGGIEVGDIRQLSEAQDNIRRLSGKRNLSAADMQVMESSRNTIKTVGERVIKQGESRGVDMGRQVSEADALRAVNSGGDSSASGVSLQLNRANAIAQALYVDDKSLRKLGKGGVDKIKAIESSYLQMLRLTGGDAERLSTALTDDKDPLHKQAVALRAQLQGQLGGVHALLAAKDLPAMTDAEVKAEQVRLKEVQAEREAPDEEQLKSMTTRLGVIGGVDTKDSKQLHKLLGGLGENKRKDLMLAIEARERLAAESKKSGRSLADLGADAAFAEDFARSGSLSKFGGGAGGEDMLSLQKALKEFAPDKPAVKQEMTIKGKLVVDIKEGTGDLDALGFSVGGDF